jgi:NAD(P)-dependent dehydrogenase (short-subunit alcohol dehydrogenase family)
MQNLFSLLSKNALITGAASGLGKAIANGFSEFGATVVIADADFDQAQSTALEINEKGRKALAVQVDVLNKKSIARMVEEISEQLGTIDILVNSAGINRRKELLLVDEEDWDQVVGVNLKGTFLCTQAVGQLMVKQKKGRVINMSSILGSLALPTQACYASSKGGVIQFTKVAAVEWAVHNITVNAIGPSYIETPLVASIMNDPERYRELVERNPMKRFGKPEEVVGVAVFLASDAASFITGQTIFVDGGWTAC